MGDGGVHSYLVSAVGLARPAPGSVGPLDARGVTKMPLCG